MDSSTADGGVTVIWNPQAGGGRSASRLGELQAAIGARAGAISWRIAPTLGAGCGADLAAAAAQSGSAIVAAAGGDGTCCEVLNGLMRASVPRPALAVLPMGTGNDFARTLGIGSLDHAAETMFAGQRKRIDAGCVNGFWFLNAAGCGFDAVVAEGVRSMPRSLPGKWAYIFAAAVALPRFSPVTTVLVTEAERIETRCMLCTVANARNYGGGMMIAPDAKVDDGELDICVLGEIGRIQFVRAFPSVFRGRHVNHPKVRMIRSATISITMNPVAPLLVDGDVIGTTPAQFSVVPKAIEVLAPQKPCATHGWRWPYNM
ncbi:MAG: YegS/Rv2252/BmrU family lipid kinase [Armatimonadetes bacterium]|nr:YegS/Rv2252/BmrU family lipid kinase [Armatimonadota bacterium]MDE2205550.1 YegS/Rv2252/BmrU family lipid kinase [Armatimonadota bacterium]